MWWISFIIDLKVEHVFLYAHVDNASHDGCLYFLVRIPCVIFPAILVRGQYVACLLLRLSWFWIATMLSCFSYFLYSKR